MWKVFVHVHTAGIRPIVSLVSWLDRNNLQFKLWDRVNVIDMKAVQEQFQAVNGSVCQSIIPLQFSEVTMINGNQSLTRKVSGQRW